MLLGARRFSALAALVARIYGGYKLIQWTRGDGVRLARHHRRSAEGAYRLATRLEGLPIKVCQFVGSRADILPAARALAAEIARETAPVSVAIAKWLLWGMASETDLARADDLDARAFWWTGTQPDAREGVRAFLEKRPPRWSMRPSRDLPDFLSPPSRAR